MKKTGVDDEKGDGGPGVKKRKNERMEDAKSAEIEDQNGVE